MGKWWMGKPRAAGWNLSRTLKVLALVLAFVILLPILGLALIIFSGETVHRTALERFLESALDRPVEIAGSVILSLSLSPKLSVSDLKISEALEWQSDDEAHAPFLRLGKGEFQRRSGDLRQGCEKELFFFTAQVGAGAEGLVA